MQQDFHYYAIYQLAELAGFNANDSETIAYASQYVDDSTESEPVIPFEDQHFDTVRTAHYNLEAFGWNVQKKIYMPFHFLPTTVRWASPETFSYCTTPAGEDDHASLAHMLFEEASKESTRRFRLIRMGVALHTIADTFAHFGFSGRHHNENDVGKIWHARKGGGWKLQFFSSYIADVFVPRIGHVEASSYPDYPYLKWRYARGDGSQKTRDNLAYSLDGINAIYKKLKAARTSIPSPSDLSQDHPADYRTIKSLLGKSGDLDDRIDRWITYTRATEYDKTVWRKAALKGDHVKWDHMSPSQMKVQLEKLKGKAGFDQSKWAYFHRAAMKQRSLVLGWIN
ncbi:MAG: DUF6765 family protein [Deltaproteobacteria bacterium]|nr:DUF6765 family protein [Deltaproteobacteria bacterium]